MKLKTCETNSKDYFLLITQIKYANFGAEAYDIHFQKSWTVNYASLSALWWGNVLATLMVIGLNFLYSALLSSTVFYNIYQGYQYPCI